MGNIMTTLSTSILVGIIALDKLNGSDSSNLIEAFLQLMHISLLITVLFNLIQFAKKKKYLFFLLTALPLVLLAIAFIGILYEYKFTNLSLIVFDFYLIFWFFFLTIREFDQIKAN